MRPREDRKTTDRPSRVQTNRPSLGRPASTRRPVPSKNARVAGFVGGTTTTHEVHLRRHSLSGLNIGGGPGIQYGGAGGAGNPEKT
jgi:hypothetical protein